jgi:hypothetical protein
MQTNLPTVARISETVVWLVASNPTRARDPRTEITRPKDVTVLNLAFEMRSVRHYGGRPWTKG